MLKVQNRETGEWEDRPPFDKAFLEFMVKTSSQYDGTCRRLAAQVLEAESRVAELERKLLLHDQDKMRAAVLAHDFEGKKT